MEIFCEDAFNGTLGRERGVLSTLWMVQEKGDPGSSPFPDLYRWAPEPLYRALTLVLQFVKEIALISLPGHWFLNLIQVGFPLPFERL